MTCGSINQSVSDSLSKLDHTTKSVLKQVERNLFESHARVYGEDDKTSNINTINDRECTHLVCEERVARSESTFSNQCMPMTGSIGQAST